MHTAYILLGSNIGDREQYILKAIDEIGNSIGKIQALSSFYQTEPWGVQGQEYFMNAVICIKTTASPHQLLSSLLDIEKKMGRIRKSKNDPRIIDLDILYFDHQIIKEMHLEIPHPRLHLRKFTLIPLAEISSDFLHPVYLQTNHQLLTNCEDQSDVAIFGG